MSWISRWLDTRAQRHAEARVAVVRQQLEATQDALTVANIRLQAARQRAGVASGVKSSMGRFEYESNTAWQAQNRPTTVERMLTDAHVEGVLRYATLPLVSADWSFEPASEDTRDQEIAEFCASVLLRQSSDKFGPEYWCASSWSAQRLPEILRMLADGFAMFHTSWRIVGGKRVCDRIQWLEPASVDRSGWNLSKTDEILSINRTYQDPTGSYQAYETMDAEDVALYPWNLIGARYEGRAMIRALYGAWSRKDAFLRAALAWANKIGDPVPVGHYPEGMGNADKTLFAALVAQLRGEPPPELYGAFPIGADGQKVEIGYAGSVAGEVDRMRGLIDGENAELAHGGGTKSMLLGETQSGSRALGTSIGLIEKMGPKAIANTIIEWETHGAGNLPGIVETLVRLNYGDARLPTLTCRNLDPAEKTQHIPELVAAVAQKVLPPLPQIQQRIAAAYGVDLEIEEFERAAQEQQEKADALAEQMRQSGSDEDGQQDETDDQEEPPDGEPEEAAASLAVEDIRRKIAPLLAPVAQGNLPKNALRWPNVLETECCDLATVRDTYRTGETEILASLRKVHRSMVDELVERVRKGSLSPRNVNGIRRAKFRGRDKAVAALRSVLESVATRGIQHVGDDLERMQRRTSLAALPRVGAYQIVPRAREELLGQIETIAELDLDRLWSKLLDQALPEFLRMDRRGLTGDELVKAYESYLTNLSEKSLEDVTREEAGRAYNEGRDAGIQTAAEYGQAQYVIRSEVLDDNTCDVCRSYDGKIVAVDSDEYVAFMPPAGCEGGSRCRGFYVIIPPEK